MTEPDCPVVEFTDPRIDMAYWFPKLREIDVPTPESQPLPLDRSGDGPPSWNSALACGIVEDLGGEAFVRSGYKSAQYGERGGHIRGSDRETVEITILDLASDHAMMKLPMGESIWLREYLDLDFVAYEQDPLVPEVRAFIRDGEVVCHHPRLEGFDSVPGGDDYRDQAATLIENGWNHEVGEYAERVAEAFDGWWSVDFVMTRDFEWYCTDMALDALYHGEERRREGWQNVSEHAEGCANNLMEEHAEHHDTQDTDENDSGGDLEVQIPRDGENA